MTIVSSNNGYSKLVTANILTSIGKSSSGVNASFPDDDLPMKVEILEVTNLLYHNDVFE